MVGTRAQHVRVRHAVVGPTVQQGRLSGQRGLGLHLLVTDSRQPLRRQMASDRGAAGVARLRRAVHVHGVQRLHSRALRPPGHAARRRSHARERVDLRARHLGIDGRPVRRRTPGRGRRVRDARGAVSRRRLALGRRSRPAARGRRVGDPQRLLCAVAVVVRHFAGRPGHSTPGKARVLQLAAVTGRTGHRRGAEQLCRAGGGRFGRDDAGAPSRHFSLRRRVLWRDPVGRRRLPCRATGADAPGAERAGRTATPEGAFPISRSSV